MTPAETRRNATVKSWNDADNRYPLLMVLAEAEAEPGKRAQVSTIVRRAINEYLEARGIFTLQDAQARAQAVRLQLEKAVRARGKKRGKTIDAGKGASHE